jgi:hypothetical protein
MLTKIIDLNDDLSQIYKDGYTISVIQGFLIVENVPYVNSQREIKYGKIITELSLSNEKTIKPPHHKIYFQGDYPCDNNGQRIPQLQLSRQDLSLKISDGVIINHEFSNKPGRPFNDYHEKVTHYIKIIENFAKAIDDSVSSKRLSVNGKVEDNIFYYSDTNSSRAGISFISNKLYGQKIGIIGIGGTGSYVLDFIAKTPVQEIHLFDEDNFEIHNAFRSPGAPAKEYFEDVQSKVDYHANIYSRMHKGVIVHQEKITADNMAQLLELDYVFVCIDIGSPKSFLFPFLIENKVKFIDVGIGISVVDNALTGMIRTTSSTPEKSDHVLNRISTADTVKDDYSSNIQIAELNALNACHAVIKWKKMSGFYHDIRREHNFIFALNNGQVQYEDF